MRHWDQLLLAHAAVNMRCTSDTYMDTPASLAQPYASCTWLAHGCMMCLCPDSANRVGSRATLTICRSCIDSTSTCMLCSSAGTLGVPPFSTRNCSGSNSTSVM